jgi:hypothetical protein
MWIDILNKILVISFFLSCLTTLRHGYYFIQAYFNSTAETPVKYKISKTALVLLGIAIAYIMSVIFTGISIN